MRVLSMDPGVTNIGYSVIYTKEVAGVIIPTLTDFGAFTVGSEKEKFNDKMDEESFWTYNRFEELHNKYNFTHCCWEIPPSFGAMSQQSRILSNVSMFKSLIWKNNYIQFSSITPVGMKKALTGDGKASKKMVKDSVVGVFPELKGQELAPDVYDAIGIGLTLIRAGGWKLFK